MQLSFYGAARTVTGSKHLLEINNKKYLLDCGMFQGLGKKTVELNSRFGFEPGEISAVFLSHAHIDHSGLLPKLIKEGFTGKIYATESTIELSKLLLTDSAYIQENDIQFINKTRAAQGKSLLQPLYTKQDALNVWPHFSAIEYGKWNVIDENIELLYVDAGHILGSASIQIKAKEKGRDAYISFSGDVGKYRSLLLHSPHDSPPSDYIIMESTYGNSLHDHVKSTVDEIKHWIIKTCVENKGKLILPAFALGRTQEILFALNQLSNENSLPDLPYYVDSPLALKITDVMQRYKHLFNKRVQKMMEQDDYPFFFKGLRFTKTVEESKMLNYNSDPMVIISSSGMAEAGRVKHHISNNIENSRNAIVFTGYCEPQSLGGRLKQHPKEVHIFGINHQVNATIGEIATMSAHADYDDLSQWLSRQNPLAVKNLFLVHGEYDVQIELQQKLYKKGFKDVQIPAQFSHFKL